VWALSSALSHFGERIRRAIDQTADLGDVDSSGYLHGRISRGTRQNGCGSSKLRRGMRSKAHLKD